MKFLTKLEIGVLIAAIVGAPLMQVAYDSLYSENTTTSLYFKEGNTLTLTIDSYSLNYTLHDIHENFSIEAGIYLRKLPLLQDPLENYD
ncbi:MAG: hypothetical protein ACFFD4_12990 [Candidatus Odinarchaeota archaeon]